MASAGIGAVRLVGRLTVLLLKAVQAAQESDNCSLDTQMIPFQRWCLYMGKQRKECLQI